MKTVIAVAVSWLGNVISSGMSFYVPQNQLQLSGNKSCYFRPNMTTQCVTQEQKRRKLKCCIMFQALKSFFCYCNGQPSHRPKCQRSIFEQAKIYWSGFHEFTGNLPITFRGVRCLSKNLLDARSKVANLTCFSGETICVKSRRVRVTWSQPHRTHFLRMAVGRSHSWREWGTEDGDTLKKESDCQLEITQTIIGHWERKSNSETSHSSKVSSSLNGFFLILAFS